MAGAEKSLVVFEYARQSGGGGAIGGVLRQSVQRSYAPQRARLPENLNKDVDKLLESGTLERIIAQIDVSFSNSLIESWWRSLKHGWLFINHLNNVATLRNLVEFYVVEHNTVMPFPMYLL